MKREGEGNAERAKVSSPRLRECGDGRAPGREGAAGEGWVVMSRPAHARAWTHVFPGGNQAQHWSLHLERGLPGSLGQLLPSRSGVPNPWGCRSGDERQVS